MCWGHSIETCGLRSPGPARKGNLPHRGGTQDVVVFQRVLVPLKQVGSSRAARICPKAFASCPRLVQRARLKKWPSIRLPLCFVLVSPFIWFFGGLGVPGYPCSYASPYYFENLRRAGNATSKTSLGRRTLFFRCTTYG